jgi:hypothetical protein
MANMNSRTRKRLYQILSERDGDFCAMCGKIGTIKSLCIDHEDNNNTNNDLDNLQLLCRSCNTKKNPRGKAKPENQSAKIQEPRASKEVLLNERYEPVFRKYVDNQIMKHGRELKDDIVDSGAEVTSASILTIERYLRKLCSTAGKYQVIIVEGRKYVELKEWFK